MVRFPRVLAVLAMAAGVAGAGETARGVVFDDANANGVRDAGEAGVAGVGVSDGRTIVETDTQGRWSLTLEAPEAVLFVIQPRGWRVPTDANRVRRFSYVHKPAGSPEGLEFAGVAPTGPLPASIDFPLRRAEEPETLRVAVLGDPQPRDAAEIGYMQRDVVEGLLGEEFDLVLALGDIMFDDLDLYDEYNRAMGALGVPVVNVHGNHDLNFDVETDALSDETWERVYGPATFAFDFGPAHFIVVDNVVYEGASRDRGYHAAIGERNMAFIRAALARLAPGTPVVLAMHIPLEELRDRAELLALLGDHDVRLSLGAHQHQQRHTFFGTEHGWTGPGAHHALIAGTACGSWWTGAPDAFGLPHSMMRCGTPTGWTLLEIADGLESRLGDLGYRLSYRAARRAPEAAMHLHAPIALAPGGEGEVLANVWFAMADDPVEMRIDGGLWRAMERVERVDPYYAAIKAREESDAPPSGRRLPSARPSPHLWALPMRAAPTPGAHVVEVRWTDAWGRVRTGRSVVRVDP